MKQRTCLNSAASYAEIELPGNHIVRVYDYSSIYFGDYYRVKLEVRCEIPLPPHAENVASIRGERPACALYSRVLEKMAVPSAAVEDVKRSLLAEFRQTSLPYMAAADFPEKLIASSIVRQIGVKKGFSAYAE